MPELSKEMIAILGYLLPGILVMFVVFSCTSYQKPVPLERVFQALVATFCVKAMVAIESAFLHFLGGFFVIGQWDTNSELVANFLTAIGVGWLVSIAINTNFAFGVIRRLVKSSRSGAPSEWCQVFDEYKKYLVLHLKDGRRIAGYPLIWPSNPKDGHIFITDAAWLDDSTEHPLTNSEGILISTEDIEFVEILK